jgi:CheY-like chemotaxis protein
MQGSMGLRSTQGEGSTFWFTVRLGKGAAPKPVDGEADLNGVRALVVDDNAVSRSLLEEELGQCGMTVDAAGSAETALDLLAQARDGGTPFAVALLDRVMPGTDGIELARTINAQSGASALPLILLAAVGSRGDSTAAKAAGFAAYLTKPIRREYLRRCVMKVLGVTERCAPDREPDLVTRHSIAEEMSRERARLLLAEDNPVNQKVAVKMLEKLGYRVDVVADGKAVVEALEKASYAVVLMDCYMPEMDGYAATRAIREREGGERHTPIIALTADATQASQERCVDSGMDDFVTKPVKRDVLAKVLERWLERGAQDTDAD